MTDGLPRYTGTCSGEYLCRILEAVGECKAALHGHVYVGERDVCLPDCTLGHFTRHNLRLEARRALFDEEATDVAIVITRPNNCYISEGCVTNPALYSIDDVFVAYSAGTCL